MTEGRLSATELEERLGSLFAARTYGEVDALLADLPASRVRAQPRLQIARWAGALGAFTLMLAVLGMLATAHGHSAAGGAGAGHLRRFDFGYSHHGLAVAASLVGVLAVVLVCAGLFWVLAQPKDSPDAGDATSE
jgi:hypothetical protein